MSPSTRHADAAMIPAENGTLAVSAQSICVGDRISLFVEVRRRRVRTRHTLILRTRQPPHTHRCTHTDTTTHTGPQRIRVGRRFH